MKILDARRLFVNDTYSMLLLNTYLSTVHTAGRTTQGLVELQGMRQAKCTGNGANGYTDTVDLCLAPSTSVHT